MANNMPSLGALLLSMVLGLQYVKSVHYNIILDDENSFKAAVTDVNNAILTDCKPSEAICS